MIKRLMTASLIAAGFLVAGCDERDVDQAGEEVGRAAEDTREAAQDFGEAVERGAEDERNENRER